MTDLALIIFTLILSAFFSGTEIAFISANRLKIEVDKGKGMFGARILSTLTKNPARFIGTILLGNNVALVIYGIAMANILDPVLQGSFPLMARSATLVLLTQTLIATLIILFLAEFLPKALFRINPNNVLNFFAIPILIVYYLLYPVVIVFIGASEWVLKYIFKVQIMKNQNVFGIVDLDDFLKKFFPEENKDEDVQQDIQIFQNAMEFGNIKIRECMIPRPEVLAVDENENVNDLRKAFVDNGFSKILVYRDSIDNVIGYVHSFDMFSNPSTIKDILRPVLIVPETMMANNLMTKFIQQHKSIAVVVDEFGGTSGMVTMEDMIEEIFGEIVDEFDDEELTDKSVGDNEYIFSARLEIDFINDKYNLKLPVSEEYETIAGLIIHYHESIPTNKEKIIISPFEFEILHVTESKIEQVKMKYFGER